MANDSSSNTKHQALRQYGALNARPEQVKDPLFRDDPFFDPNDLVQVKYEMLRRVRREALRITDACAAFGFSRPSFYQAQAALEHEGLAGLAPKKRGPRAGHKLTEEVLAFVKQQRGEDNSLAWSVLGERIEQRFGVKVHPRSIERALDRAKKTPMNAAQGQFAKPEERLMQRYEALRLARHAPAGFGQALLVHHGMAAWIASWSRCMPICESPPGPCADTPLRGCAPNRALPIDVESQIVHLLAQMAWDRYRSLAP